MDRVAPPRMCVPCACSAQKTARKTRAGCAALAAAQWKLEKAALGRYRWHLLAVLAVQFSEKLSRRAASCAQLLQHFTRTPRRAKRAGERGIHGARAAPAASGLWRVTARHGMAGQRARHTIDMSMGATHDAQATSCCRASSNPGLPTFCWASSSASGSSSRCPASGCAATTPFPLSSWCSGARQVASPVVYNCMLTRTYT
jgi:hypothetical protein